MGTMRRLSWMLISLLVLILLLAAPASAIEGYSWEIGSFHNDYVPQTPGDFAVDKGTNFDIYYNASEFTPLEITSIYMNMSYAFTQVTNFFGTYPYHTKVILAGSTYEYQHILQDPNISDSELSDAFGEGNKGAILIKSPELVPDFQSVLAMDMASISIRSNMNDNQYNLPQWFSEGLALYISGNLDDQLMAVAEERDREQRLLDIDQINLYEQRASYPETDPADVQAANAQAGMVIQYTAQQFGNASLAGILGNFSQSNDIDLAYLNITKITPQGMNIQWQSQFAGIVSSLDGTTLDSRIHGYVTDSQGKPMTYQTITFSSLRNDSPLIYGKTFEGQTDGKGFYIVNVTYGPMSAYVVRAGYPDWYGNITMGHREDRLYNVTLNSSSLVAQVQQESNNESARGIRYAALGVFNALGGLVILFVLRMTKK